VTHPPAKPNRSTNFAQTLFMFGFLFASRLLAPGRIFALVIAHHELHGADHDEYKTIPFTSLCSMLG
jgi:hypothetical protein